MTLDEAKRIVHIWGLYLEYCQDRLRALFLAGIPESLLPYPPETLEEALNIVGKYYYDSGDYEASELVRKSFGCLMLYDNDDKALQDVVFLFSNAELRQTIISNMKKIQKDWIKTQDIR